MVGILTLGLGGHIIVLGRILLTFYLISLILLFSSTPDGTKVCLWKDAELGD